MLRHPGSVGGALQPLQRRGVGRGGHHHRAAAAFLAKNIVDEVFHFPAPLADQAHHDYVGAGVAGHHAQQHRFAHAGAGEQTHTLAPADAEQGIDGADADVDLGVDGRARQRVHGRRGQGAVGHVVQRRAAVQRAAVAVHHPAQQRVAEWETARAGVVAVAQRENPGARYQAADLRQRHQKQLVPGEPHHFRFGEVRSVAARRRDLDAASAAQRRAQAHRLQHQAGGAHHPAAGLVVGRRCDAPGDAVERAAPLRLMEVLGAGHGCSPPSSPPACGRRLRRRTRAARFSQRLSRVASSSPLGLVTRQPPRLS